MGDTLEKLGEVIEFIEDSKEINIVGIRNHLQNEFPKEEMNDPAYKEVLSYHEHLTSSIDSRNTGIPNRTGALNTLRQIQENYSYQTN